MLCRWEEEFKIANFSAMRPIYGVRIKQWPDYCAATARRSRGLGALAVGGPRYRRGYMTPAGCGRLMNLPFIEGK